MLKKGIHYNGFKCALSELLVQVFVVCCIRSIVPSKRWAFFSGWNVCSGPQDGIFP